MGSIDRFDIVIYGDIGDVTELRIGLGGGAFALDADWRLKSVELNEKNSKNGPRRYSFPCEHVVLGGIFHKAEASFKAVEYGNQ